MDSELEARIREYETVNKLHTDSLKYYIQIVVFIGIGIGVIGSILANVLIQHHLETYKVAGLVGLSAVVLIHLWLAGWAFIGIELWSQRAYLEILENDVKKLLKVDDCSFSLFRTKFLGIYKSKFFGLSSGDSLLIPFIAILTLIYLAGLNLGVHDGLNIIFTYLDAHNAPRLARICEKIPHGYFYLVSFGLIGLTLGLTWFLKNHITEQVKHLEISFKKPSRPPTAPVQPAAVPPSPPTLP
jgi:hypothetical protein